MSALDFDRVKYSGKREVDALRREMITAFNTTAMVLLLAMTQWGVARAFVVYLCFTTVGAIVWKCVWAHATRPKSKL